ncbi:Pxr1, partial [Ophiophagus hannah]
MIESLTPWHRLIFMTVRAASWGKGNPHSRVARQLHDPLNNCGDSLNDCGKESRKRQPNSSVLFGQADKTAPRHLTICKDFSPMPPHTKPTTSRPGMMNSDPVPSQSGPSCSPSRAALQGGCWLLGIEGAVRYKRESPGWHAVRREDQLPESLSRHALRGMDSNSQNPPPTCFKREELQLPESPSWHALDRALGSSLLRSFWDVEPIFWYVSISDTRLQRGNHLTAGCGNRRKSESVAWHLNFDRIISRDANWRRDCEKRPSFLRTAMTLKGRDVHLPYEKNRRHCMSEDAGRAKRLGERRLKLQKPLHRESHRFHLPTGAREPLTGMTRFAATPPRVDGRLFCFLRPTSSVDDNRQKISHRTDRRARPHHGETVVEVDGIFFQLPLFQLPLLQLPLLQLFISEGFGEGAVLQGLDGLFGLHPSPAGREIGQGRAGFGPPVAFGKPLLLGTAQLLSQNPVLGGVKELISGSQKKGRKKEGRKKEGKKEAKKREIKKAKGEGRKEGVRRKEGGKSKKEAKKERKKAKERKGRVGRKERERKKLRKKLKKERGEKEKEKGGSKKEGTKEEIRLDSTTEDKLGRDNIINQKGGRIARRRKRTTVGFLGSFLAGFSLTNYTVSSPLLLTQMEMILPNGGPWDPPSIANHPRGFRVPLKGKTLTRPKRGGAWQAAAAACLSASIFLVPEGKGGEGGGGAGKGRERSSSTYDRDGSSPLQLLSRHRKRTPLKRGRESESGFYPWGFGSSGGRKKGIVGHYDSCKDESDTKRQNFDTATFRSTEVLKNDLQLIFPPLSLVVKRAVVSQRLPLFLGSARRKLNQGFRILINLSLAWEIPRARPMTLLRRFFGCGNSFSKSLVSAVKRGHKRGCEFDPTTLKLKQAAEDSGCPRSGVSNLKHSRVTKVLTGSPPFNSGANRNVLFPLPLLTERPINCGANRQQESLSRGRKKPHSCGLPTPGHWVVSKVGTSSGLGAGVFVKRRGEDCGRLSALEGGTKEGRKERRGRKGTGGYLGLSELDSKIISAGRRKDGRKERIGELWRPGCFMTQLGNVISAGREGGRKEGEKRRAVAHLMTQLGNIISARREDDLTVVGFKFFYYWFCGHGLRSVSPITGVLRTTQNFCYRFSRTDQNLLNTHLWDLKVMSGAEVPEGEGPKGTRSPTHSRLANEPLHTRNVGLNPPTPISAKRGGLGPPLPLTLQGSLGNNSPPILTQKVGAQSPLILAPNGWASEPPLFIPGCSSPPIMPHRDPFPLTLENRPPFTPGQNPPLQPSKWGLNPPIPAPKGGLNTPIPTPKGGSQYPPFLPSKGGLNTPHSHPQREAESPIPTPKGGLNPSHCPLYSPQS